METQTQHTLKRFDEELVHLNESVVAMARAVEEQLARLGDALVKVDAAKAEVVVADDKVINNWEVELDAYLETLFSRRQPQAADLRVFLGYYRMTIDLERLGDEVRNAAKGVRKLVAPMSEAELKSISTLFSLHALLRVMGDDMIACIETLDVERSRALVARREVVSSEVGAALAESIARMKSAEVTIDAGLELIRINRALERIAAHMQNVGETVIFMREGVDIHHEQTQAQS